MTSSDRLDEKVLVTSRRFAAKGGCVAVLGGSQLVAGSGATAV